MRVHVCVSLHSIILFLFSIKLLYSMLVPTTCQVVFWEQIEPKELISKEPDEIFVIIIATTGIKKLKHRLSLTQKCPKKSSTEWSPGLHPRSSTLGIVFSTQHWTTKWCWLSVFTYKILLLIFSLLPSLHLHTNTPTKNFFGGQQ